MQEKEELQQHEKQWAWAILIILFLIGITLITISAYYNEDSAILATILRDIGFVFAPVAILALFYQRFAQKEHIQYITKEILMEIEKRLGPTYGHKDIVAIHPVRNTIEFNKYFTEAKNNIDIMVTNLMTLDPYAGLLFKLANKGVNVRILALNPKHEFLKIRYKELHFQSKREFYREMFASLRTFCSKEDKIIENKKSNFSIRTYDNTPSLMLFRRDNRIIVGFILQQEKSRDLIHIDFDCTKGKPSQDFMDNFNLIWKNADYANLEIISKLENEIENEIENDVP